MDEIITEAEGAVFDVRTANERLAESRGKLSKPLFGDLWKTGEIGEMLAEPGNGKSILAVQIADSIARGRAVGPFDSGMGRQKVLYLDLGSSPGHFQARYNPDEGSSRAKPYAFSKNILHFRPLDREIRINDLEPLIERTGARILIIDSLAHLMDSAVSSKEAAAIFDPGDRRRHADDAGTPRHRGFGHAVCGDARTFCR